MERSNGNKAGEKKKKKANVSSKSTLFSENVGAFGAKEEGRAKKLEILGRAENGGVACNCGAPKEVGGGGGIGDSEDMEILEVPFDAGGLYLGNQRVSEANGNQVQCSESDITEEKVDDIHSGVDEVSCTYDRSEETESFPTCLTPVDGVFDPFAPCSEKLVFAPRKRVLKLLTEPLRRQINFNSCFGAIDNGLEVGVSNGTIEEKNLQVIEPPPLRRHIDFDSCRDELEKIVTCNDAMDGLEKIVTCNDAMDGLEDGVQDDDDVVEELRFMELMYRSFIDVIVSNQIGKSPDEGLLAESLVPDGLKTPTAVPLLTGVAGTCPGAPNRRSPKSRNFTRGICRKLEF